MLPAPRIIVIDDNQEHLRGLADGLNRHGAACLQVHFTGDASEVNRCPYVRVVFADLHLNESGAVTDNARHFSVLGGLLEQYIAPAGPYALVLWTRFPDQAEALRQFLDERLSGIPRPFSVTALDKSRFLGPDGKVTDPKTLVDAIASIVQQQPPTAALLNWEESVLGAAAETVSALIDLAGGTRVGISQDQQLARLLRQLAIEAVGKGHVEKDRFHAVNEALLPILADRVAFLKGQTGIEELWKTAFEGTTADSELSIDEVAKLNRLLHIADSSESETGSERGAVMTLPARMADDQFVATFGITEDDAASAQFACQGFVKADNKFKWMLLQVQAICDFAQSQPGPLPVVLGLEMPLSAVSSKKPPGAVFICPVFYENGEPRIVHFNARFQVSLPQAEATTIRPAYRIREPLLSLISYSQHGYGARPGIISFRQPQKAKVAGKEAAPKKV